MEWQSIVISWVICGINGFSAEVRGAVRNLATSDEWYYFFNFLCPLLFVFAFGFIKFGFEGPQVQKGSQKAHERENIKPFLHILPLLGHYFLQIN